MRFSEIIAKVYRGVFTHSGPLAAVLERKQSTTIRHWLDCYDEAPSARCLSFRQMFSSPASTDSSSPTLHLSCLSSSDGSSTMTSPLPSPGSWHTTRQLSDVVVIDSPSRTRHSMAASSWADPLQPFLSRLASPANEPGMPLTLRDRHRPANRQAETILSLPRFLASYSARSARLRVSS